MIEEELAERRDRMVATTIEARGIHDERVLAAMREVPRERFLPEEMVEFAYQDTPLPIEADQTISQPYIVAVMAAAAEIRPGDRVLEIGTGSGYGAAVLSRIAAHVDTIERHATLAEKAAERLTALGYDNVTVLVGDGTLGWPDGGSFDAIVVTAAAPTVPQALLDQLADGGRMVVPVGEDTRGQALVRLRRREGEVVREDLGPVRFVPLLGAQGFHPTSAVLLPEPAEPIVVAPPSHARLHGVTALVAESAHPFASIETADLAPILERIGDASVVLLGEASHGTSEFYRMRDRLTRALITRKGFTVVAVEADWPDAARLDAYVRGRDVGRSELRPFARFPSWMWRNHEVAAFARWLRDHNARREPEERVSFHGLDLYSLFASRDEVLHYLDDVDPGAATLARRRYSCLTPWQHEPAEYGRAVVTGRFAGCEDGVVSTLHDLLRSRLEYASGSGDDFMDAAQNAMVVADAEQYYRVMYYGSPASWNLRDQHMFETLRAVQSHRGPGTKVVVWEHNSHVGDASATEMGAAGEHNVGMLARREFGDAAFLVGFGTDHGTVAAASDWGGPLHHKAIRPAHPDSYERVFHDTGVSAAFLHLREPDRPEVRSELSAPRLERAIGVIYRPETELRSHYFQAELPSQFDEYIWFDETTPVTAFDAGRAGEELDTFPFGL